MTLNMLFLLPIGLHPYVCILHQLSLILCIQVYSHPPSSRHRLVLADTFWTVKFETPLNKISQWVRAFGQSNVDILNIEASRSIMHVHFAPFRFHAA